MKEGLSTSILMQLYDKKLHFLHSLKKMHPKELFSIKTKQTEKQITDWNYKNKREANHNNNRKDWNKNKTKN